MKYLTILFTFSILFFTSLAAVPLRWTVETSRATPATFEAYQGETLALEAALQSYGKPLEAPSNYSLYWQTNGMGSTYWSVPCIQTFEHSEHSNILYATWSPTNDVGSRIYNCFIGQPGTIYHAAFQLRLRPSPGATPNELPLPQKVIDFAKVTVLNPPWSGGGGGRGGVDTNAVRDIVRPMIGTATNGLRRVDDIAVYEYGNWTITVESTTGEWGEDIIPPSWNGSAWVSIGEYGTDPNPISNDGDAVELRFTCARPLETATVVARRVIEKTSDRLATTNGVNAAIEENEKTGTEEQIIRGYLLYGGIWNISVDWSDRAASAYSAGEVSWSGVRDKPNTLSGYGITDAATKMELAAKQDALPYPTNAIPASVITGLEPPSSPTLRLYDEVRQCWWIGRMVNGVINWEVE